MKGITHRGVGMTMDEPGLLEKADRDPRVLVVIVVVGRGRGQTRGIEDRPLAGGCLSQSGIDRPQRCETHLIAPDRLSECRAVGWRSEKHAFGRVTVPAGPTRFLR